MELPRWIASYKRFLFNVQYGERTMTYAEFLEQLSKHVTAYENYLCNHLKGEHKIRAYQERISNLEREVAELRAAAKTVNVAPPAWTNPIEYALQDELHNRLTPRVIDIAYTTFMLAKEPTEEDGGNSDWFNYIKPSVMVAIAKLRKDLVE